MMVRPLSLFYFCIILLLQACTLSVEIKDLSSKKLNLAIVPTEKVAPSPPSDFNDLNFSSNTMTPRLSWLPGTDVDSGVAGYQIAIGSASGLADVYDWISVGDVQSTNLESLNLNHGQMYYPMIRTVDRAGNVSSPVIGDGFRAVSNWLGFSNNSTVVLNEAVQAQAFQSDGKMIVGGNFTRIGGSPMLGVGLLNSDGTPVDTFQKNPTFSGQINDIAVQSDNKLIVVGEFGVQYQSVTYDYLVRLFPDGQLDSSFQFQAIDNDINVVDVQADGKILVGGTFEVFDGVAQNYLTRINADGSRDLSFDIGTGPDFWVTQIAALPSGKILISGGFSNFNGVPVAKPLMLNSDGSIDSSFDIGSGFSSIPSVVRSVVGGKILFCGGFTTYKGASANRIIQLSPDGSVDGAFVAGTGFNGTITDCIVESNGKIMVVGSFTTYDGSSANGIARLNANGSIDSSFSLSGAGFTGGGVNSIRKLSDGTYIAIGAFTGYNGNVVKGLAKIDSDGSLIAVFNTGESFTGTVIPKLEILSNDQIVIGSTELRAFGGTTINRIMRLNTDRSIDGTFNVGTGISSLCVFSCKDISKIIVQEDGKVMVAGRFQTYQGISRNNVVRINSDGSLDATFNPGTGVNGSVYSMIQQPDGKAILGGDIYSYNGAGVGKIVRINLDGTRDLTFNSGTGFDFVVKSLTSAADGKIYVGGEFTSYNGTAINNLVRLNSDGTLDSSFSIGASGFSGGFGYAVGAIVIDSEGRILVGGSFSQLNGQGAIGVVRLLGSGERDLSFNTGITNASISSISIQSDGTIILGGSNLYFQGIRSNGVLRLNEDGSLDSTFNLLSFNFDQVSAIIANAIGEIFIVGSGTSYGSGITGGILKLGW